MTALPRGFLAHARNLGIKDATLDFVVVASAAPCATSAVFTRSRFAGPSVLLSRAHAAAGPARAMVVVSKNANVATGEVGARDAHEVAAAVAARLGCDPREVLLASTGVIGRAYPMDRVRAGIAAVPPRGGADWSDDAGAVARAIMTTDTVPKVAEALVEGSSARVVGVAKGVGMIEPDMATMIAVVLTDAAVGAGDLDATFRRVVDETFNCVSVDSDTSTSDTAVCLASGAAGPVDPRAFARALHEVARSLTLQIARDGEGAEKLIEVEVDGARDSGQARRVAKAIVNSPLVKTAVHGADPNWGRVAMAVGKSGDEDVREERVVIRFGAQEVYPRRVDEAGLAALAAYMRGDTVRIHVSLGVADAATGGRATVWGCDLTAGYVRINADYTT
ncbi:MAG: glutamate N-acetyltransferase/amino-acid acetyltransferase [Actinomycetota bacterium]